MPTPSERIQLRIPVEDLKRWRALARRAGDTLSAWMRRAARAQEREQLRDERRER